MKTLLRISTSGVFQALRITPRMLALPSVCIYPTSNCNYDCIMCESRRSNRTPREQMEFPMMQNLLSECAGLWIKPRIHFSGLGEPLMYRDIDQVMSLCFEKKLFWSVTTNGLTLKQHARQLVENGCHGLNLSVHGTPDEHNRITNTPNAFEKVAEGLLELEKVKHELKRDAPLVAVNCVINDENVSVLDKIYETFSKLPIHSITFQHVAFSKEELKSEASFIIRDDHKIKQLSEFIQFINAHDTAIPCRFFPGVKDKNLTNYYKNLNYPENKKCYLPWLSARIYPNGDVKMCEVFFGNLREHRLKELINNEKAIKFRHSVRKNKFDTKMCYRCCHRRY